MPKKVHEREELLDELLKEFRKERREKLAKAKTAGKKKKKKHQQTTRKVGGLAINFQRIERKALDERALDRISRQSIEKPWQGGRCG